MGIIGGNVSYNNGSGIEESHGNGYDGYDGYDGDGGGDDVNNNNNNNSNALIGDKIKSLQTKSKVKIGSMVENESYIKDNPSMGGQ